jgi:hypothetical protein
LSLDPTREPICPTSTQEDGTERHCRPDVVALLRPPCRTAQVFVVIVSRILAARVLSHPKFLLIAWVTAGRMLTFVIYVVIIPPLVLNISVLDISDKVIRVSPHQCWIELSTGGDIKRPQENARRCRIPDELPASNRSSHRRQATPIGYDSLELVSKRGKIVYELVGFVLGQTPKRHTTVAPAAMTVKGQTEGLSRHFGVQVFQADWVRTQLPNGAKQQRIWESEVITVGSGCVAVLSFSLYRILNYQKLYLVHLAYFGSNDFG